MAGAPRLPGTSRGSGKGGKREPDCGVGPVSGDRAGGRHGDFDAAMVATLVLAAFVTLATFAPAALSSPASRPAPPSRRSAPTGSTRSSTTAIASRSDVMAMPCACSPGGDWQPDPIGICLAALLILVVSLAAEQPCRGRSDAGDPGKLRLESD
jgi:hypothetical protein